MGRLSLRNRSWKINTSNPGNGCLLVVYDPATEGYVPWLAGMPQSHAVAPFKAPVDESKITVRWLDATDDWNNLLSTI